MEIKKKSIYLIAELLATSRVKLRGRKRRRYGKRYVRVNASLILFRARRLCFRVNQTTRLFFPLPLSSSLFSENKRTLYELSCATSIDEWYTSLMRFFPL